MKYFDRKTIVILFLISSMLIDVVMVSVLNLPEESGYIVLITISVIGLISMLIAAKKDSDEYEDELLNWYDKHKHLSLEYLVVNKETAEDHLNGLNYIRYCLKKRDSRQNEQSNVK